jgi:hypothetical protein
MSRLTPAPKSLRVTACYSPMQAIARLAGTGNGVILNGVGTNYLRFSFPDISTNVNIETMSMAVSPTVCWLPCIRPPRRSCPRSL